MEIDLNCDLGEGCASDEAVMPWISSANIACAAHAGSPTIARGTLKNAMRHGLRIGAHPGYADPANFGRRELDKTFDEILNETVFQVSALSGMARILGACISYLKPHGALYNQACRVPEYAKAVVEAGRLLGLPIVGLPCSALSSAALGVVAFIPEGFADRRYLENGQLVPRSRPDALIANPGEAAQQILALVTDGGTMTFCVHGDQAGVEEFLPALHKELAKRGVSVKKGSAAYRKMDQ